MSARVMIDIPLNRVEGDLEVRVEVEGGVVTDSWVSGTMYRGFERIMVGRGAMDGLVITPRVCGICCTSHLTAAALALDAIAGVTPPPDALRVRNLALMTEHIQSDIRHAILMFAAEFVNPAYSHQPLFDEAVRRYEPFKGEATISTIRETKKVLEMVAILGGQWPHSSYMVPGGVVGVPTQGDLLLCKMILRKYRAWYEARILGCSLERWAAVAKGDDLEAWLEEHGDGELGFFLRYGRALGLDRIGAGTGHFLSVGALDMPEGTAVTPWGQGGRLVPAGLASKGTVAPFDQARVMEHVAHSWYLDEGAGHPSRGKTMPYATGLEGKKYSWAKAPRYDDLPAETGPLAEALVAGHPLFTDLFQRQGSSVLLRHLSRLVRPAALIPAMEAWLGEIREGSKFYISPGPLVEGEGVGLTHAARGALGHWVRVEKGLISHYQIVTPTAWNASPRDASGLRGPMEEALMGTEVQDATNPVELGQVVRSFDPCLVCTVHAFGEGRALGRVRVDV